MTTMNTATTIKIKCPKQTCQKISDKKVLSYNDGTNHVDGLKYFHLECLECGCQFLEWNSTLDEIKKVYGINWRLYM